MFPLTCNIVSFCLFCFDSFHFAFYCFAGITRVNKHSKKYNARKYLCLNGVVALAIIIGKIIIRIISPHTGYLS